MSPEDMEKETQILTDASLFITLDGNQYEVNAPSDKDYAELNNWLRALVLKRARDSSTEFAKVERDEVYDSAVRVCSTLFWDSPTGSQILNTNEGVAKLTQLFLRKKHPNFKLEELGKMLTNPVNIQEVKRAFDYFMDLMESLRPPQTTENSEGN